MYALYFICFLKLITRNEIIIYFITNLTTRLDIRINIIMETRE
jgi:hypothetical protein